MNKKSVQSIDADKEREGETERASERAKETDRKRMKNNNNQKL